jgi:hypothetical protein
LKIFEIFTPEPKVKALGNQQYRGKQHTVVRTHSSYPKNKNKNTKRIQNYTNSLINRLSSQTILPKPVVGLAYLHLVKVVKAKDQSSTVKLNKVIV